MNLKYQCTLLSVKDVEVSKKFYRELFNQEVVLDLGLNVTFSGGFAIQQSFAWLIGLNENDVVTDSKNMELYFEVDDFDEFVKKLDEYPEVRCVHKPKTYDWMQRVVRIYDPDCHIIEIGESMAVIAKRYLNEGKSVEEVSKIIQHPVEFVSAVKDGHIIA